MYVNAFDRLSEAPIFEFLNDIHDEEGQVNGNKQSGWLRGNQLRGIKGEEL
jgi:hypothetical protein